MYALSNNQLDPVQAQSYQPQLDVPLTFHCKIFVMKIKLITEQHKRMGQGNPFQAQLNAQNMLLIKSGNRRV
jgi:hypothetical protein